MQHILRGIAHREMRRHSLVSCGDPPAKSLLGHGEWVHKISARDLETPLLFGELIDIVDRRKVNMTSRTRPPGGRRVYLWPNVLDRSNRD